MNDVMIYDDDEHAPLLSNNQGITTTPAKCILAISAPRTPRSEDRAFNCARKIRSSLSALHT